MVTEEKARTVAATRAASVDPKVRAAVKAAKPFSPQFWRPLLKMLLFHIYFVPTSFIFIPLIVLRCIIPALRPNPNLSFASAAAILNVRRAMRNFIRFRFQPIQPREGGLRDRHGFLAATLSLLNFSGPGGNVTHPKLAIKAAAQELSRDKVWFDPPPLELFNDVLSIQTGKWGSGKVKSEYYNGPPLVEPKWAKTRTCGYWFMHKDGISPPLKSGKHDRPVILYFHGGAGVTFSASDMFMGQGIAKNLAHSAGVDVFSIDYILAPFAPFPVPLVQALAGYLYLHRQLGYRTDQIYIGGDSFGGWLTLQLERFLRLNTSLALDDPESLPSTFIPGLILLSPWIDSSGDERFPSRQTFHTKDIINGDYSHWGLDALKMSQKHRTRNPLPDGDPWYTHCNRSTEELAVLPPVFIANGGGEVLLDEGLYMAKIIREAKKLPDQSPQDFTTPPKIKFPQAEVVSHVTPYMAHDFFTLHTELGRSKNVYRLIGTWIKQIQNNPGAYSI